MFATLTATAATTTTLDMDVLADMGGLSAVNLDVVKIAPDSAQKPTFGDSIHFYLLDADGVTIDQDLGSCNVNPNEETSYDLAINSAYDYTLLSSGQKVRAIYTSVALLVGGKVALTINAANY